MTRYVLTIIFTYACIFTHAQVNIITTIAGKDSAGYSGDGGPATNAKLNDPYSICMDLDNNLLFCDGSNHVVRKINLSTGIITTIAGTGSPGYFGDGGDATSAQLFIPEGICIDAAGNIYIADGGNYRIRKISTTGTIITIAGNGTVGTSGDGSAATGAQLNGPGGLRVRNEYLYVSDCLNHKLRKINLTTGIISTVAGTGVVGYSGNGGDPTIAQFNGVIDVDLDDAGNIFISDSWNGVIRKISVSTNKITTIVGTGVVGYSGDNGPAANAQLNEPTGIFVDKHNNLFIADYRNGAIRKVSAITNVITTEAGGNVGYGGDGGPATNAKLKCTNVCTDDNGNIYITDYVNHRIRKVSSGVAVTDVDKGVEAKLFPNPTTGVFSVHVPAGISLLTIYNIGGVAVLSQTITSGSTEVDLSGFPSGIYLVYVRSGDKLYVNKVMKN